MEVVLLTALGVGGATLIGAILGFIFKKTTHRFSDITLSFAAGAMVYVVVEELIPESNEGEHSNLGTIGFAVGFAIMMILDVVLG